VDALNRNLVFVSDEEKDFQAKIPNQTTFVSKVAMESGNKSFHVITEIHEIQNIFTLSKVTKERLEQLVEKNSQVHVRTMLGYFKCNLSTTNYE
jgi:hypothetical protein